MHDGRDEDELSRCLARFVTGEDRLFSAICYERRWSSLNWAALHWVVNCHFYRLRDERNHCRSAWRRERAEAAPMPDRARMAGL